VHLVRAGLLRLGLDESKAELRVVAGQDRVAVLRVVGQLPTQDAGPEAREPERVVRVEGERDEP
jgi:hypothetical protein